MRHNNIINFNKARITAYIQCYEKTGIVHHNLASFSDGVALSYARHFPSYNSMMKDMARVELSARNNQIREFEEDLEQLKDNFKTESTIFMFPTVLSKYRRGMNPVRALYYELQKTLFQFDKNNYIHNWMLNLFSDKEWSDRLIKSLEIDYNSISKFQQKYLPAASISKDIERKISILNNVKDNLNHFREVFMLMQDTEYRKL